MDSSKTNKIELRSEPLQEVLGQIPHWIVRIGTIIILAIIVILIFGCWFFKYPDTVLAEISITANNPSSSIIAKSTGKLEKIFVSNNQKVNKEDMLAIIENTANYKHILLIKSLFDSLNTSFLHLDLFLPSALKNSLMLGEIQVYYSSFLKQYQDYCNFISLNYYTKRIESVDREIKQQQNLLGRLFYKLKLTNDELFLEKKQHQRDSILFKNEVLPAAEYEKSQKTYIDALNNCEGIKSELITLNVQITKLQQSILDFELQKTEQSSKQKNALKESLEVLSSQVASWEKSYVLKASFLGRVTFTEFWNTNQNVKTGDIVFNVVPDNFNYYVGRIQLPIKNSGKVEKGQKVIIKLDNYPYMEFGMLQCRISSISLVSDNNFFVAEVQLPSKLITTYGKKLLMTKELKGSAEIITNENRLLNQLIYPLQAFFNKNKL